MTNLFENLPKKNTKQSKPQEPQDDDMFEDTIKQGTQEIVKITKKSVETRINLDGKWLYESYNNIDHCMSCGEKRLCYENTCIVCDNFMTEKEYNKHFPQKQETVQPEIIPEVKSDEKFEIQPVSNKLSKLPSTQEIDAFIDRYNYVKNKIVDKKKDFAEIQGRRFLKKSGWRKFINAFGISIELISKEVYEAFNDKHAEVRVRAIAPTGQIVEGLGIKSMSELYTKTLHNLIANAWTRAVNRAVSDLVAFGEVSAEEVYASSKDDEFTF